MNSSTTFQSELTLEPNSARRLANLCGQFDEHLKQIEQRLQVDISNRGHEFQISGPRALTLAAQQILLDLYAQTEHNEAITPNLVHLHLQEANREGEEPSVTGTAAEDPGVIRLRRAAIKPRGANQRGYVRCIQQQDINFGIGPAGTGKTYLAVACAVAALEQEQVRRILLVRPAVEAGEKLGFLPGDLAQKIDPYLRPLYDALYEMLGFDAVGKLIERNIIEVAPLAYMRGRTLNNSFIILDESQNTTKAQMKMFLTRIGFGATAVITGDLTQIDLPKGTASGLIHASTVLHKVDGIGFTYFQAKDVVRHALVQRIVEAYDRHELQEKPQQDRSSDRKSNATNKE